MRFTKSDIEEIARRIAVITKRDSELPDADIPLHDNERVPIIQYIPLVQDYENRLLSLADLRSLVLADIDQTAVGCVLGVICDTDGAVVTIKGAERRSYAGYYGEMVDVIITADGYDTWIGVVTMTQDHTLVVSLNKEGGGSTPGAEAYYVMITNSQSASITFNGTPVASGSPMLFAAGTDVNILVSKDGFEPWHYTIDDIADNFSRDVTLTESESEDEDPFIVFTNDTLELPKSGASMTSGIKSNCSWEILSKASPSKTSQGSDYNASNVIPEMTVATDESIDIENDMGLTYKSRNSGVAKVEGTTVTGVSSGETIIDAYKGDTLVGSTKTTVADSGSIIEPESIKIVDESGKEVTAVELSSVTGRASKQLRAVILPSNADQTVTWSTGSTRDPFTVDQTGLVVATGNGGTTYSAYVMAKTGNGKLKAKCSIICKAAGTYVTSVTPANMSAAAFQAANDDLSVNVVTRNEGGIDTGVKVTELSGFRALYNPYAYIGSTERATPYYENGKLVFNIHSNYGNERELRLQIQGNESGDEGKILVIKQAASSEASGMVGQTTAYFEADGTPSPISSTNQSFTGSIYFVCGFGRALTVLGSATLPGWIHLNTSGFSDRANIHELYGYNAAQHAEYRKYGTIDGKVPDFSNKGMRAAYFVELTCDANTTGARRTGTIKLPGVDINTYIKDNPSESDPDGWMVDPTEYPIEFQVIQSA